MVDSDRVKLVVRIVIAPADGPDSVIRIVRSAVQDSVSRPVSGKPNVADERPLYLAYAQSPGVNGQSFQSIAKGGGAGVGRDAGVTTGAGGATGAIGGATQPARARSEAAMGME